MDQSDLEISKTRQHQTVVDLGDPENESKFCIYSFWPNKCIVHIFFHNSTACIVNSVDPDQLASEEASWSGSTLFFIHIMTHVRIQEVLSEGVQFWWGFGVYFFFIFGGVFLVDEGREDPNTTISR